MTMHDKPVRRIVTIDDADGRSKPLSIGPVLDISRDLRTGLCIQPYLGGGHSFSRR